MQWVKANWLKMKKRQLSFKEMIAIYGMIGIFLIGSLFHLQRMGFTPSTFLIQNVISSEQNYLIDKQLFYSWMYTLTGVEWNHPERFIFNLTPLRKQVYKEKVATGEIKGYFSEDEETNLILNPKNSILLQNNFLDYALFNDVDYVYKNYMSASSELEFGTDMFEKWNFYDLVTTPITLPKTNKKGPQILIFHTHCMEDYIGGATVVDIGEALKETLEKDYGIEVLHIAENFYTATENGLSVTGAYERMEPTIKQVLKDNPTISVVIDLHRDGVNAGTRLVTTVDGKETAKIMFVNGLCMNRNRNGEVEEKEGLPNPYIGENLAFSLQMMVKMNELYPGLSRRIYLREWRFSTHMAPYSILMEWGADTNTSEEAYNAVEPVAKILASVLQIEK